MAKFSMQASGAAFALTKEDRLLYGAGSSSSPGIPAMQSPQGSLTQLGMTCTQWASMSRFNKLGVVYSSLWGLRGTPTPEESRRMASTVSAIDAECLRQGVAATMAARMMTRASGALPEVMTSRPWSPFLNIGIGVALGALGMHLFMKRSKRGR